MIPDTIYPGTPPEAGTPAFTNQIEQIKTIIGKAATNKSEAKRLAVMFFIPDMSYHRGAISQALKEIEREFTQSLESNGPR